MKLLKNFKIMMLIMIALLMVGITGCGANKAEDKSYAKTIANVIDSMNKETDFYTENIKNGYDKPYNDITQDNLFTLNGERATTIDAAAKLQYDDIVAKKVLDTVKENKTKIDGYMDTLAKNPNTKFKDAYQCVQTAYTAYVAQYNHVITQPQDIITWNRKYLDLSDAKTQIIEEYFNKYQDIIAKENN